MHKGTGHDAHSCHHCREGSSGHEVHAGHTAEPAAGHAAEHEHRVHAAEQVEGGDEAEPPPSSWHACHDAAGHGVRDHGGHDHESILADYLRRLVVSSVLTVPVVLLSPTVRQWLGLSPQAFAGSHYVLAALAAVIYLYGGWPFIAGLVSELRRRQPGMMTLVGLAVPVVFDKAGTRTQGRLSVADVAPLRDWQVEIALEGAV